MIGARAVIRSTTNGGGGSGEARCQARGTRWIFWLWAPARSSGPTSRWSPTSAPPAAARPADGDILIRREVGPRGPCTVSRVPGAADGFYGDYENAVQQAEAMAKQAGVDVWYTEDHQTFKTLRAYRDASRRA